MSVYLFSSHKFLLSDAALLFLSLYISFASFVSFTSFFQGFLFCRKHLFYQIIKMGNFLLIKSILFWLCNVLALLVYRRSWQRLKFAASHEQNHWTCLRRVLQDGYSIFLYIMFYQPFYKCVFSSLFLPLISEFSFWTLDLRRSTQMCIFSPLSVLYLYAGWCMDFCIVP